MLEQGNKNNSEVFVKQILLKQDDSIVAAALLNSFSKS